MMGNLTAIQVKTAKPKYKTYKLSDGAGMYLEITPKGAKYWRTKYYYANKEKRLSLGVYPTVNLKEAREANNELKKLIQQGIDPSAYRQAQKLEIKNAGANTFEAVAKEWFITRMQDKSPSHQKRTQRLLDTYLYPAIGKMPIKSIEPLMMLSMLKKIEAKGYIETTKKTRQTASQVFCYGVATGRVDRDPTKDITGALQTKKARHYPTIIDPQAIGKLLLAIEHYQGTPQVMTALKLIPLVFTRPSELWGMEWQEIDWFKKRWELPAEKMKMKEPHIVPLCQQAIDELKKLRPITEHRSKYVFPNPRGASRSISDNAVRVALRSMGYSNEMIVPHGFRAMARTLLEEELGYRVDYIEQQLAHAVKDPNGRAYNRTKHLKERIEMMQAWADYLYQLRNASSNTNQNLHFLH